MITPNAKSTEIDFFFDFHDCCNLKCVGNLKVQKNNLGKGFKILLEAMSSNFPQSFYLCPY